MKHLDALGNSNYDERAFIKDAVGKIKFYGGKSPSMPAPTVAPAPKKEFSPVTPEDTSAETMNKTGPRSLRIELGQNSDSNNSTGNGLNITK